MEELSEDVELVLRVYVVVQRWQEGRWWYGKGVRRRVLVALRDGLESVALTAKVMDGERRKVHVERAIE